MTELILQNLHRAVKMALLPENDRVIDVQISLLLRVHRHLLHPLEHLQRLVKLAGADQQHAVAAQQTRLVHALFIRFLVQLERRPVISLAVRSQRLVAGHVAHKAHRDLSF